MAKPGPKRTPTRTLALRGSWRARQRANEPEAPAKAPTAPKWLGSAAKAEWKRATKLLLAAGIITELDRGVMTAYCQAWGDFVECQQIVAKEGRVARGKGDAPYAHPAAAMMMNARNSMVKYAAELGMSPTSRPGIHAVLPAKPDAFDEFLARKKDRYRRG